jgi:hypothetical protein
MVRRAGYQPPAQVPVDHVHAGYTLVLDVPMTSPDADEPHAIADTQMFRRFVEEEPGAQAQAQSFWQRLWAWPMLLIPVILSVVIVAVVIAVLAS